MFCLCAPRCSDFLKAYHYVNKVKQFRDREVVNQVPCAEMQKCQPQPHGGRRCRHPHPRALNQVRRDLESHHLRPFEVAQIGNLCPQDAQEAKALIPSLDMPDRQLDNAQLTELLNQVNAYVQFS